MPPLDGPAEPLGYGYVTIVHSLLRTTCPHLGIRVVNAGAGATSRLRWQPAGRGTCWTSAPTGCR